MLTGIAGAVSAQEPDKKETFTIVEEKPTFPGRDAAMYQFLGKNIDYPIEARRNGVEGKVLVIFVINKDGSIDQESLGVADSVDPYLDKEAMRVIGSMPAWSPGMQKGKPVRVRMVMPVFFKLGGSSKAKRKKRKKKRKNNF